MNYIDTQRPLFSFLYAVCCDTKTSANIKKDVSGYLDTFNLPDSSRRLMIKIRNGESHQPDTSDVQAMWPDLKKDLLVPPSTEEKPASFGQVHPDPHAGVLSLLFALLADPATARALRSQPEQALKDIPQDPAIRGILLALLREPDRALTGDEADALRPRIEEEILGQATAW